MQSNTLANRMGNHLMIKGFSVRLANIMVKIKIKLWTQLSCLENIMMANLLKN